MKKRGYTILKIAVALVLAIGLIVFDRTLCGYELPAFSGISAKAAEKEYFNVQTDDDGELVIRIGALDAELPASLTIPSYYDGKKIERIGANSFSWCSSFNKVVISEGITHIGKEAFMGCKNLKVVVLPKSLKTIEEGAFSDCTSLEEIVIPEGVTVIEEDTFSYCNELKKAVLPSSLETIRKGAFKNCENLEEISIPASVKTIEDFAFYKSRKLSIEVAPDNSRYASASGALYNKDLTKLVLFPRASSESISLPETVRTIGSYALDGYCQDTLYLPQYVEEIEDNAIGYSKVTSIEISPLNTALVYEDDVLYSADKSVIFYSTLNYYCESYSAPETVKRIAGGAFANCSFSNVNLCNVEYVGDTAFSGYSIKSYDAPKLRYLGGNIFKYNDKTELSFPALEELGAYAFVGCYNLESFYAPNLRVIGDQAFSCCSSLKNIDLSKAEYIGEHAFSQTAITKLETNAEIISDYAFSMCEALEKVVLPKAKAIGDDCFANCSSLKTVDMPAAEKIGAYAFSQCSDLNAVAMPRVKNIEHDAFSNCTALTEAMMPELTKIDGWAFYKCISLTSVSVPKLSVAGSVPFYGCSALKTIEINADFFDAERKYLYETYEDAGPKLVSVSIVGTKKYRDLSNLITSLNITSATIVVEADADRYVDAKIRGINVTDNTNIALNYKELYMLKGDRKAALKLLNIPENAKATYSSSNTKVAKVNSSGEVEPVGVGSAKIKGKKVTVIGTHAFCFSRNMQKITLPNTLTEIEEDAFNYCSSLKAIVIPDSVTSLGGYQFFGCSSLAKVTLSKNLTEIADRTFVNCPSLKELVVPEGVKSLGNNIFYAGSGKLTITLPISLKTISDKAFNGLYYGITVKYRGTKTQWNKIKCSDSLRASLSKNITYSAK